MVARGPGDRALPGIVLSCFGIVEPFLVVPELTKRAGREDLPEPQLAEIDIGGRVPTKVFGHHHLQLRDLLVERSDDADLPDNNGRVGALRGRGLPCE